MDLISLAMINGLKKSGGVGHAETAHIALADTADVTFEQDPSTGKHTVILPYNEGVDVESITLGSTITVHWDGKDYELAIFLYEGAYCFGNQSLITGRRDTGEPFFGTIPKGYPNGFGLFTADTVATHTVGIYAEVENISTINPKFLPKGSIGYKETVLAPLTGKEECEFSYSAEYNNYIGKIWSVKLMSDEEFPVGTKLLVYWDGIPYECLVRDGGGFRCFGNDSIFGDTNDTGEPFAGDLMSSDFIFYSLENTATHTVQVFTPTEVIHPMDCIILKDTSGKPYMVRVSGGTLLVTPL